MPVLRPYQREDVAAVLAAHQTHQCVIGRAPTGSGKAVALAALAQHYAQAGRVMVLVDTRKLVLQLAQTIEWYTGVRPGVEMADSRANNGGFFSSKDKIVVSTVQTQYSGDEGKERYRSFDPAEYSACLLDECELFLAPKAMSVVAWYRQNPATRVFGTTATPMRTDGVAMAELFDHCAFDRDILWGIEHGWLVKARQAFVRVSLDFTSLKVRKGDDGERDYSEAELAERINNEQTLIELAKGIRHVAGPRRSIVVCPDVATAQAVAHYLDADQPGSARCVYGEMSDQGKDDAMDGHKRGDFQFLVSVMMLTKGYDDPEVSAVFNCRKTRSKRLYSQILGRGTRPLTGLVDPLAEGEPGPRIDAIAASAKPDMIMVNLVGVDEEVRDITLIDVLGEKASEAVRQRAKQRMLADHEQGEFDPDDEVVRAKNEEEAEEARKRQEEEKRQRRRLEVQAAVEVEYEDGLGAKSGWFAQFPHIPAGQLEVLRRAKVDEKVIARMTPATAKELSRRIISRHQAQPRLCTYRQAMLLRRFGYSREELEPMSAEQAGREIDAIKQNGWKRPVQEQEAW